MLNDIAIIQHILKDEIILNCVAMLQCKTNPIMQENDCQRTIRRCYFSVLRAYLTTHHH
jgi:hypothetical protein